jgi:hypothetical protein
MSITAETLLTIEERTLVGMSLLHDIVNAREYVTDIAHGVFDKELRLGLFYALHDRYATNAEECSTPLIDNQMDVFKLKAAGISHDQQRTESLFAALDAYDRRMVGRNGKGGAPDQQARVMEMRRKEFVAQTQPHAEGTVKEIAAKYNLSLSEVRRRKAAGIPFNQEA